MNTQKANRPRFLGNRFGMLPKTVILFFQTSIFAISAVGAFLLRFDLTMPRNYLHHLYYAIITWIVVKVAVFRIAKLDRGSWRYVSVSDLARIAVVNLAASVISYPIILLIAPKGFPRSIYILELIICFLGTSGLRFAVRVMFDAESQMKSRSSAKKTVLIYGAGNAGVTLLREIRSNPKLPYRVVGFVDDRPDMKGLHLGGAPVLGRGDDVAVLVAKHEVETILIAISSATGAEMTRILEVCHAAGIECRTVPGLGEIIEGSGLASRIRPVAVEDLLGRTPVRLDEGRIFSAIEGKMVLVTGAAGSIGSELCRQIERFHPAGIVGFEIAESPLFEIVREMQQKCPHVPFYPEIGSIQNYARLAEVFRQYKPAVVFHAAAYKHVPLMETHIFEAVENNIFGTYNVARVAEETGVESFVMISSDKAVRPTNIMGATKRVAELLLLELQNGRTKYVAVRFGNVLGSNGSVIPIFKKQIAEGGPVTITHPEMRRFFMTIPEACQLVLQASALGNGGQICVLDMGQPVRILDLARKLILLSGLKPDEDIKIDFTGMRPGEKLCEELSSLLENTIPSDHEKIRLFVGGERTKMDFQAWLESMRGICETRSVADLVMALKELVLDYNPSTHLLKRMVGPRSLSAPNASREPLPTIESVSLAGVLQSAADSSQ